MLVHGGLVGGLISTQIAGCHVQSFWFSWTMARQFASLTGPKVILMLLVPGAHVESPSPSAQWVTLLPSGKELEL